MAACSLSPPPCRPVGRRRPKRTVREGFTESGRRRCHLVGKSKDGGVCASGSTGGRRLGDEGGRRWPPARLIAGGAVGGGPGCHPLDIPRRRSLQMVCNDVWEFRDPFPQGRFRLQVGVDNGARDNVFFKWE